MIKLNNCLAEKAPLYFVLEKQLHCIPNNGSLTAQATCTNKYVGALKEGD